MDSKVNVSKAKSIYPTATMGAEEVDVTDEYVYLGVTFNYNASFREAIRKQVTRPGRPCLFYWRKLNRCFCL